VALQSNDAASNGFTAAVRDRWLSANFMPLFTTRSPFIKMMMMRGSIKPAGYGNQMREPLMVPVLTGPQLTGVSTGYADNPAQPMTGFTSADYVLSEYAINVSVEDYQMAQAGGPEEMVRWHEAIFKNANIRALNKIRKDFWAAPEDANSAGVRVQVASILTFVNGGTTTATDGGADPPAQAEQSATPYVKTTGSTAVTTVGNIPRAAVGAAYWCPPLLYTSATALTVQTLNDLYEAAFQDGEEPDIVIMPPGLFSKIQNLITVGGANGGQVFGESGSAKLGFSHVRFREAVVTVDRFCPTAGFLSGTATATNNNVYVLNLKHMKLRLSGKQPKYKDVPTTQLIEQSVGAWRLALTADHLGNVHSFSPWMTT
jgi:hypothetical protein